MELIQRLFENILGEAGVRVHIPCHKKKETKTHEVTKPE